MFTLGFPLQKPTFAAFIYVFGLLLFNCFEPGSKKKKASK